MDKRCGEVDRRRKKGREEMEGIRVRRRCNRRKEGRFRCEKKGIGERSRNTIFFKKGGRGRAMREYSKKN